MYIMLKYDFGVVIFSCRLIELSHFYTSETNIKSVVLMRDTRDVNLQNALNCCCFSLPQIP